MPSVLTLGKLAPALGIAESVLLPGKPMPEEELINALYERGVDPHARRGAAHDIVADVLARGSHRPLRAAGAAPPPEQLTSAGTLARRERDRR